MNARNFFCPRPNRAGFAASIPAFLLALSPLLPWAFPAHGQFPPLIHPATTRWSIWTNGVDPGYGLTPGSPDWAQRTFDDSAWPTGYGLFGNDSNYPYPFQTITPHPSVAVRFYARTHFTWSSGIRAVTLRGTNFIDDGAVVYLNGVEIYRINMPEGPTTFETLAPATFSEPVIVPVLVELDILTNGNANPLVFGDNVIAVETTSNGRNSSDTVWGMSLYSSPIVHCDPPPSIAPTTTNALACRNVTFFVTLPLQCPGSLQWYRNVGLGEEPIPGQTQTSLTISNVDASDAGRYYVRKTDTFGVVDSAHSVLNVTPDNIGPQIVDAEFTDGANAVLVTFDEPFLPAARGGAADDARTWTIRSWDGRIVPIASAIAEAGNPTQVRLTMGEPLVPGVAYETTQPIADACAGASTPPDQTGYFRYRVNLLHWTDGRDWRFNQSGADQGTAWKEFAFDDSSWEVGPQGFGNETGGFPDAPDSQRTTLVVGPTRSTYYFRTRFAVPAISNLLFRAAVDDGAVIYVNGTEIGRINVPDGPVKFDTLVPTIVEGQGYVPAGGIPIPPQLLRPGQNVLAVEVHQAATSSADVLMLASMTGSTAWNGDEREFVSQPRSQSVVEGRSFALSVLMGSTGVSYQWRKDGVDIPGATLPTYSAVADANSGGVYRVLAFTSGRWVRSDPATVIVRRLIRNYSDVWKYQVESQNSTLTGLPWSAVGFDDASWPSAPGPFGLETTTATLARLPSISTPLPAPSSNQLTTYFRSAVNIPTLAAGEGLFLSHVVDDGAAFYVDGNLAFTYNLGGGQPILSSTLTPEAVPGDGDAREITIPIALAPGMHTLAVEVHQNGPTSNDAVLGAEITRGPAFPQLTIAYATPTSVRVTWTPTFGVRLSSASTANGVFTAVPGDPQGNHTANVTAGSARFFRLDY